MVANVRLVLDPHDFVRGVVEETHTRLVELPARGLGAVGYRSVASAAMAIQTVGIVGSGIMGSGIAEVAALLAR